MLNFKLYNYDEEFASIDDMMIEKNFVKEIMFSQPNQEQLAYILNYLAGYEGYLYQLYSSSEGFFSSGVVSMDSIEDDLASISTYKESDEEGIIKGKTL